MISRRALLAGVCGIAATWPFAGQAQSERVRRVGVLLSPAESDTAQRARNAAFERRLRELGWIPGGTLQIEYRWASGELPLFRRHADELIAMAPDVIVGMSAAAIQALQERTQSIPIVFQFVSDPVAQGFVQSFALPGGNMTGLANFDSSLGGKWLQLIKELSPAAKTVLLPYSGTTSNAYWRPAFEAAAPAFGVELTFLRIVDVADLRPALSPFAMRHDVAAVMMPDPFSAGHRDAYIQAMTAARVPTVYTNAAFARAGGLASYGPDILDLFRNGADLVDRILRGEKPANMPIRSPTKFELVVNLRAAKALGISISESMLLRADEVIE